jgi:hypothetical protein
MRRYAKGFRSPGSGYRGPSEFRGYDLGTKAVVPENGDDCRRTSIEVSVLLEDCGMPWWATLTVLVALASYWTMMGRVVGVGLDRRTTIRTVLIAHLQGAMVVALGALLLSGVYGAVGVSFEGLLNGARRGAVVLMLWVMIVSALCWVRVVKTLRTRR